MLIWHLQARGGCLCSPAVGVRVIREIFFVAVKKSEIAGE